MECNNWRFNSFIRAQTCCQSRRPVTGESKYHDISRTCHLVQQFHHNAKQDGKFLATGGNEKKVRVFEIDTANADASAKELQLSANIFVMRYTSDGSHLLVGCDKLLQYDCTMCVGFSNYASNCSLYVSSVISVESMEQVHTHTLCDAVKDVEVYSHNSTVLVTAGNTVSLQTCVRSFIRLTSA